MAHTSNSTHTYYYVQKEAGMPVHPLTYRTLRPLVQTNTPEFAMLEKYRKTRTVSRSLGFGSLGLMVVGATIAFRNIDNANVSGAGGAMFGARVLSGFGWLYTTMGNSRKLLKTIIIADKSDEKGSHERVK